MEYLKKQQRYNTLHLIYSVKKCKNLHLTIVIILIITISRYVK